MFSRAGVEIRNAFVSGCVQRIGADTMVLKISIKNICYTVGSIFSSPVAGVQLVGMPKKQHRFKVPTDSCYFPLSVALGFCDGHATRPLVSLLARMTHIDAFPKHGT